LTSSRESYCRFPRGRARVCPYQLEEQNKAMITILNQIRDLLQAGRR